MKKGSKQNYLGDYNSISNNNIRNVKDNKSQQQRNIYHQGNRFTHIFIKIIMSFISFYRKLKKLNLFQKIII